MYNHDSISQLQNFYSTNETLFLVIATLSHNFNFISYFNLYLTIAFYF